MINNDILIRLRYALNITDLKLVELFAAAGRNMTVEELRPLFPERGRGRLPRMRWRDPCRFPRRAGDQQARPERRRRGLKTLPVRKSFEQRCTQGRTHRPRTSGRRYRSHHAPCRRYRVQSRDQCPVPQEGSGQLQALRRPVSCAISSRASRKNTASRGRAPGYGPACE